MNKNEQNQANKVQLVQEAIKYLQEQQVLKRNVTKKEVALTLKKLYPEDKEKQISQNTLSKPFYKQNFDKWLNEIYRDTSSTMRVEKSKKVIKKNLFEKLKRIEKYGNELIDKIAEGKVECPKFTRKFLRDWIVTNKGEELSESIFSSTTQGYKELFDKLQKKFLAPRNLDGDNSHKSISLDEVGKLNQEIKVYKRTLDNLISQQFVVVNSTEKPLVEGDGNEFKGVYLDKQTLYGYFEFMKNKFDNEIDAYELFRRLVQECDVKQVKSLS